MLLDYNFWKCLGKALGWGGLGPNEDTGEEEFVEAYRCPNCGEWLIGDRMECPSDCDYDGSEIQSEYMYRWHKLIDHLAEGGTIESYF